MSQIDNAAITLKYELNLFAKTIPEQYRDDFFHPMNRDAWIGGFCDWLATKQRKRSEVRASND